MRKNKPITAPSRLAAAVSPGLIWIVAALFASSARGQEQAKPVQDPVKVPQQEQIPPPDPDPEPIEEGTLVEDPNVPPIVYDPAAAHNEQADEFKTGAIKVTWYKTTQKYKFQAEGVNINGDFLYFPKVEPSSMPKQFTSILKEVQTQGLNAAQNDVEANPFYYRCYRVKPKPLAPLFSHHVAVPKTSSATTTDPILTARVQRDRYQVNGVLKDRIFEVTFPGDTTPTKFVWRRVDPPAGADWDLMLPFYVEQSIINVANARLEFLQTAPPAPSKQVPLGTSGSGTHAADGQP
jgi:hypothetical protein